MCNGRWGLEPEKSRLLLDSLYYRWYAPRPLQPEECEVDNINYESTQERNGLDEGEKKKKYKTSLKLQKGRQKDSITPKMKLYLKSQS